MKRFSLYLIFIILFFGAGKQILQAQVSLAPTNLFITDQANVSSLYISNNSQVAQEISVSFEFAYPGSDEKGNMVTVTNDSVSASRYGLNQSIKAFPRQFVIQPGKQQTVRVQVRPLGSKPNGVYWTRVIVSSQAATKNLEETKVAEGIGTKINYVFKQNIPGFYLKGKVNTGLITGQVTTSVEKGKLVAVAKLTPTGNAPYNGSVTARLTDSSGKEVASQQQTIVAYFDVMRSIELVLPEAGLAPGKYALDFAYETKRSDISPTELVQALPVKKRVEVEIK